MKSVLIRKKCIFILFVCFLVIYAIFYVMFAGTTVRRCVYTHKDALRSRLNFIAEHCANELYFSIRASGVSYSASNVVLSGLARYCWSDAFSPAISTNSRLFDIFDNPVCVYFQNFTYPSNVILSQKLKGENKFVLWTAGENKINEGGLGDDLWIEYGVSNLIVNAVSLADSEDWQPDLTPTGMSKCANVRSRR